MLEIAQKKTEEANDCVFESCVEEVVIKLININQKLINQFLSYYKESKQGKLVDEIANAFCVSMERDSYRTSCLSNIKDNFFQIEAVSACNGLEYDSYKNSCISSIRNRHLDPKALQSCENIEQDSYKLSCIEQAKEI